MTETEITYLAEKFLAEQDLRGFRYTPLDARKAKRHPGQWDVSFQVTSPQGKLIDGPAVIIVNELTQSAAFMEGP